MSGGRVWDIGRKILDLGRGDAVLAFAGCTRDAYPLMLQLQSALHMHRKLASRAYDLTELKGYMLRIFNDMWRSIADHPIGQGGPDPARVSFVLAGYSWILNEFRIWQLFFHRPSNEFRLRQASTHRKRGGGNKYFAFIGDKAGKATAEVYDLLRDRGRLQMAGLDMEPFEVLIRHVREDSLRSIGGPPQLYKVYPHMNTMPLNVYWPDRESGSLAYGGRVLRPYERNGYLAIDPDTLEVGEPVWPDPRP